MKKTQRLAAVGALAALTMSIAACSSEEEASTDTGAAATTTAAESSEATTSMAESSEAMAGGDGVTTVDDIFGDGCAAVPTEGPGSAGVMVDQAVGTAASENPIFTTLTTAVTAAGLVDPLNDTTAAYTVFGPVNDAFAAIPADTLNTLLADPTGDLATILTYHVIPERYDAAGLVEAGSVTSLQTEDVEITGTEDAPIIGGANVLCGNIPTANATVFAIDAVLMPPSMATA